MHLNVRSEKRPCCERYEQASRGERLELDLAIHFEVGEHLRLSLAGQHLLREQQEEYGFDLGELATSSALKRSVEIRAQWDF